MVAIRKELLHIPFIFRHVFAKRNHSIGFLHCRSCKRVNIEVSKYIKLPETVTFGKLESIRIDVGRIIVWYLR